MMFTLPRLVLPIFIVLAIFTSAGCIFAVDTSPFDVESSDAGTDTSDAPECTASTESELCAQYELDCGEYEVLDECGTTRVINCGGCNVFNTCVSGVCICQPEDRSEFCQLNDAECGIIEGVDRCDNTRRVSCGDCTEGEVCPTPELDQRQICQTEATCNPPCTESQSCVDDVCVCTSPSDEELCEDRIADQPDAQACGEFVTTDSCGIERTIDCGSCSGDGEDCSTSNVCCVPESDAELCEANERACGTLDVTDSCGQRRVITCGDCGSQCCDEGVCKPRTAVVFCF